MLFIENAATIEDIAAELKWKPAQVDAEARSLNMTVGIDWRGRPALRTDEARGLVSGAARINADHQAREWELARQAEQWVADRTRAIQEAQHGVLNGKQPSPSLRERAAEAGREAGRKFERNCPTAIRPRVSFMYEGVAA